VLSNISGLQLAPLFQLGQVLTVSISPFHQVFFPGFFFNEWSEIMLLIFLQVEMKIGELNYQTKSKTYENQTIPNCQLLDFLP
jgi:hypothetical protein